MKKKKYLVRDGDSEYEVTEFEEKIDDEDVLETKEEIVETNTEDESTLSDDEIAALKSLAAAAPKLLALVNADKTTDEDEDDDDDGLVTCDEDEDEKDLDVDCDDEDEKMPETKPARDSKRSFGAIERKQRRRADDSITDEVSAAWAKRYGGNK